MILASFAISLLISFITSLLLIPRLRKAGIVGRDVHKPGRPEIPEMGGLAIISGFSAGVLVAIGFFTFLGGSEAIDPILLLASMATVLLVTLIGIVDDLVGMRQWAKPILPLVAAFPLTAVNAGHTVMHVPFVGFVDFGIIYPLILVPIGVSGAANAVNMLAGFNGVEVGMGLVAMLSLSVIAFMLHATTSLILLFAGIGALIGIIYFNWYPSKILIGDVGTLSIGSILAASVIVGNFETAGIIIIVPYAIDFIFKMAKGFPKSFGVLRGGKLYCPDDGYTGLGQFIMRVRGGITEKNLVYSLIGIEMVFGIFAILLFRFFSAGS